MMKMRMAWLVVCGVLIAGCSGSSSSSSSSSSSGSSTTTSGGATNAGTTGGSSSSTTSSGTTTGGSSTSSGTTGASTTTGATSSGTTGSAKPYNGSVTFISQGFDFYGPQFYVGPPTDISDPCYGNTGSVRSGSCCYYPPQPASTNPVVYVSAGTVTITQGSTPVATFDPNDAGYYAANFSVPPSGLLHVAATGATIDAFSGDITPLTNVATTPSLGALTLSRTADTTLAFSVPNSAAGDTFAFSVTANFDDGGSEGTATCIVPASAQNLVVPGSLVSHFTATNAAQLAAGGLRQVDVSSANAAVYLQSYAVEFGNGTIQ